MMIFFNDRFGNLGKCETMVIKNCIKTCGTNFIPRFTTKMFQLVKMSLKSWDMKD